MSFYLTYICLEFQTNVYDKIGPNKFKIEYP